MSLRRCSACPLLYDTSRAPDTCPQCGGPGAAFEASGRARSARAIDPTLPFEVASLVRLEQDLVAATDEEGKE
jgi:hypothetical protein